MWVNLQESTQGDGSDILTEIVILMDMAKMSASVLVSGRPPSSWFVDGVNKMAEEPYLSA